MNFFNHNHLMKSFILCLAFAVAIPAQTVTALANAQQLLLLTQTPGATITASQGDGTACTITKLAGSAIIFIQACTNAVATASLPPIVRASGTTAATTEILSAGDVMCMLLINPTTAAITMGTLGPAPANGIAWTCTTNIRSSQASGSSVTGQTTPVTGSLTWP